MATCLNPIVLNVGIKKNKNLTFTKEQLDKYPEFVDLDISNKMPATILAPCGKCYNCRLNRARDWTIRTIHEYTTLNDGRSFMYFFTLTYDNNHIANNSLDYTHVQLFLKKLRKKYKDDTLKFLCVGEYGYQTSRMHWHLVIFGFKKLIKYAEIHKLWNYGNVDIDLVRSFSAIAYMLKYSFKNYMVDVDIYLKEGRTPPLFRCSKKFGETFALKHLDDIIKDGYISKDKYKYRIPRYYRLLYYRINFVDGWQEYLSSQLSAYEKCVDLLSEYNYSVEDITSYEFGTVAFYNDFFKYMRPILNRVNEEKYIKYFRRFYEKI